METPSAASSSAGPSPGPSPGSSPGPSPGPSPDPSPGSSPGPSPGPSPGSSPDPSPGPSPGSSPTHDNIGYEGTAAEDEGGFLPPPMPSPPPQPETQPSHPNWNIPSLSEDAARRAFVEYASDKCCFGLRPAEEGKITSMEAFNTYRYCFETFTESRCTKWSERPYYGEQIDTSGLAAPGPWDIAVNIPPFFHDGKHVSEVPHTSSVKDCVHCGYMGKIRCRYCSGIGRSVCHVCGGIGVYYTNGYRYACTICGGCGRKMCMYCSATGWMTCDVCSGRKKLVVSLNLIVKWTNNKEEYTVEQSSGLKMSKLDNVPGNELFKDSHYMVHPVVNFPDPTVVQTSERLVREHQAKYSQTSRILQQRQTIELLPITKVTYEWRGESNVFFVYGRDFKVSAVDYPAACCGCCCSVM